VQVRAEGIGDQPWQFHFYWCCRRPVQKALSVKLKYRAA